MNKQIGRFLGLIIVTALALIVAFTVTAGGWGKAAPDKDDKATKAVAPPAPVSVMEVRPEWIEIIDTYSGMIRPRERFSLGFEIAGRVEHLGAKDPTKPPGAEPVLDEGDFVVEGQLLAVLDDHVLQSRLEEARATLKEATAGITSAQVGLTKAKQDMDRSTRLLQMSKGAITQAKYQGDQAQLAAAGAQVELAQAQFARVQAALRIAEENIKDTRLLSSVRGKITKRMINRGESINPHQPIMEIIQLERDSDDIEVMLVVGVPEAFVGEIQVGRKASVELLARNRFRKKRPQTEGRVYRVAEAADQTTGLFDVEIALDNRDGIWKPGLIALARIVVDQIEGFRVPVTCAAFRDNQTFLFTVAGGGKAHRLDLCQKGKDGDVCFNWIEQGPDLIIPKHWITEGPDPIVSRQATTGLKVVCRGQHRLVEGREVQLVQLPGDQAAETGAPLPVRAPAPLVGSKP